MWELDYKENWAPKNWCFWTVVLEKTLESPLDCKEIKPVHPKGNQSSIFIGRIDAEAETPKHWPPDAKNWRIWKDPDAGKDWRPKEKGMAKDEMVGWHHWHSGLEQAPGVGDGQGSLVPEVHRVTESDTIDQLNWTELKAISQRNSYKSRLGMSSHPTLPICSLLSILPVDLPAAFRWIPFSNPQNSLHIFHRTTNASCCNVPPISPY